LALQWKGLAKALRTDPEVAERIPVTPDQQRLLRDKIRALADEPPPPPPLEISDPILAMQKVSAQLRSREEAAAIEILTPAQLAVWKAMIGDSAPFALPPANAAIAAQASTPLPLTLSGAQAARLLELNAVQSELGLNVGTRAKLKALTADLRAGDKAFRFKHESDPPGDASRLIAERKAEVDRELSDAMGSEAQKRLQQLQRQATGLRASIASDAQTTQLLGVTQDQRDKVRELLKSAGAARIPPPSLTPDERKKAFRDFRRGIDSLILEKVLTAEQREKWREAVGAPVEFELVDP
jgi:hypothetical protein